LLFINTVYLDYFLIFYKTAFMQKKVFYLIAGLLFWGLSFLGTHQASAQCTVGLYNTGCFFADGFENFQISGNLSASTVLLSNDQGAGNGCTAASADGYTDYTALAAPTLFAGSSYEATFRSGFDDQNVALWIDFNDNNIFEATELLLLLQNPTGATGVVGGQDFFIPGGFFIPCNATPGTHRLRIRAVWNDSGNWVPGGGGPADDPCANQEYGEVEDYLVTITTPLSIVTTNETTCPGNNGTADVTIANVQPCRTSPILACPAGAIAETNNTGVVGGAFQNNATPYRINGGVTDARVFYLYRAADLTAAGVDPGKITSIGFTTAAIPGGTTFNGFQIRMCCVPDVDITIPTLNTALTTLQTVLFPVNFSPVLGLNTHTLDLPYVWDGTSSIVVEICYNNSATQAGTLTVNVDNAAPYTSAFHLTSTTATDDGCAILSGNFFNIIPVTQWNTCKNGLSWNDIGAVTNPDRNNLAAANNPYTFTLRDYNGCTFTQVINIGAPTPPAAPTFTGKTALCPTDNLTLVADNYPSATTYTWTGPFVGSPFVGQTLNVASPVTFGTYTLTVAVAGCPNVQTTFPVTASLLPTPTATFTTPAPPLCTQTPQTITYTGTGAAGDIYNWNFGVDATPPTANTQGPHNVIWSTSGSKTLTLQVTSAAQPAINQTNNTATVIPESFACGFPGQGVAIPIVVAAGRPPMTASEALGMLVTVNTAVDPNNFVGDLQIFLQAPDGTVLPLSLGNGGGPGGDYTGTVFSDAGAIPITAGSPPYTGTFQPQGGPFLGCTVAGGSVINTFSNFTGVDPDGTWNLIIFDNFVDGFPSSLLNWSLFIPPVPGCTSPVNQVVVNVLDTPSNSFAFNALVCNGDPVVFTPTATGGGVTYNWTFPSGVPATSTSANPSVTWSTPGTFNVTLTTAQNGCTSPVNTVPLVVRNKPTMGTPIGAVPSTLCVGQTVTINGTATDPTDTYVWDFDGATFAPGTGDGPHTGSYAAPGTYDVTLTLTDNVPGATFTTATPVDVPSDAGCVGGVGAVSPIVVSGLPTSSITQAQAAQILVNFSIPSIAEGNGLSSALTVLLIAPDGSALILSSGNTAADNLDMNNVSFQDGGADVTTAATFVGGTFAPGSGGSLCDPFIFNPQRFTFDEFGLFGLDPNGTWQLAVFDNTNVGFTVHTITNWSITFPSMPGCSQTFSTQVVVNPFPAAPVISSNSPVCTGQTLQLTAPTIAGATYAWTGPNGFSSALEDPSIPAVTAAAAGIYSLTVTVGGCTSPVATTTVVVNTTPTATPVSSNTPLCAGATLTLFGPTVAGATYAWTGPNSFSSAVEDPTKAAVVVADAGTYSLVVTANGCASAPATTTVVVNPQPAAPTVVSAPAFPLPCATALTITPSGGGPNYDITRDLAGFAPQNGPGPFSDPTPVAGATYTITYVVAGCTSAPATVGPVTVSGAPSPPTANSNSPICVGGTLNLTASTVAGATYTWTGPNSFSSAVQNPTKAGVVAADAGIYSVTVTVAGCTSAPATTTVVVNPVPTTTFTPPAPPVCTGSNATFTYTGSGVAADTYTWNFDGATVISSTHPNYVVSWPTPGVKSVTLGVTSTLSPAISQTNSTGGSVTDFGCALSTGLTNTTTIAGRPGALSAAEAALMTVTVNLTHTFDGDVLMYLRAPNGTILPLSTNNGGSGANYTATVFTDGAGTNITAGAAPFTGSFKPEGGALGCGLSGTAINTFAGFAGVVPNGNWDLLIFDDALTDSGTLVNWTLTFPPVPGCTATSPVTTVTVNSTPTNAFTFTQPVCAGNPATLTATAGGTATYNWTFASGAPATSTVQAPSVTWASAGTFAATLTVTDNGCVSPVNSQNVTVQAAPSLTINAPSPVCVGASHTVTLTGADPTDIYVTNFGGGTHTGTDPGPYTGTFSTAGPTVISITATDVQPQTFTFSTNTAIPDNDCVTGVTAPIAIANAVSPLTAADAAAITVTVNMTHTFDGDLDFYLVAPDGSILPLSTDNGGSGDNFTNTVFSDGAGTNVTAGVAPFTGSFKPEGGALSCGGLVGTLRTNFAGFSGVAANGNWTLRVFDDAATDVGNLVSWSITLPRVKQCSQTFTANVTVNPVPAAPTANSNTPVCTGQTLNLTASTIAGATYLWTGPAGSQLAATSPLQNPAVTNVTAADAGTYTVNATVGGCTSANATTTVVVNATPAAPSPSSNSPVCEGQTLNLTGPAGFTAYTWTGPVPVPAVQNPSFAAATIPMGGIYSLAVTAANGCVSPVGTTTVTIIPVNSAPVISSNTPVCVGGTLNLTAPTIAGATYAWTGPNSFNSALEDPTRGPITAADAGIYSLTVTVGGCVVPQATTTVVVNPIPAAPTANSNSPVCVGATINLTASTVPGATYTWTGPLGFNSAVQNPSIVAAVAGMAGTYSVTATVAGCTSAFGTTTVVVNPIPAAPTASSNSPVCVGATINFTASTIAGATYTWTGPNNYAVQNPSEPGAIAADAGIYTVTATVAGCTSPQATTTVVVNPIPATPSATTTALPLNCGQALTITPSGGSNYIITGSNGFSAGPGTGPFTDPSPVAGGTYILTSTVAGCTSLPFNIGPITTAATPATPTPTSNSPVCVGGTINLTATTVAGATYSWTGPGFGPVTLQNPSIPSATVVNGGVYSLTVTVAGCTSAPGTTTVVVNPIPAAPSPVSSNSPVCAGQTLNLTGPAIAGATYNWTGPNAFTANAQNATRAAMTATDAGLYSLTVTVGGCTSPASTVNVVVNAAPAAPTATTSAQPIPCGSSFTITPSGGTAPYTISGGSFGAGSTGNGPFVDPSPIGGTTYTLIAIGGACPSLPFTIGPITTAGTPPAPSPLGNNGPICAGQTLNLTAPTVAGATYSWTGPNAFSSNLQSPSIPNAPASANGVYSLTVTVAGCVSPISTTTATVNALPSAPTVTTNSPVCSGQSITINVSGDPGAPDYSITRSDGGFTAGPGAGPFTDPNPVNGTTYQVTYTHNGCTSSTGNSATITVKPTPVITASSNSPVCSGQTINLTSTFIAGATYSWTGPASYTSNQASPAILNATVAMTGTYNIVTTLNGCTSNPASVNVVVNPTPSITATNNGPLCAGQTLNLQATAVAGATYNWSGPNGFVSNIQNPTFPFVPTTQAGTYNVIVTSAAGCAGNVASTTVTINPIPFAPATLPFLTVCQGQPISLTASLVAGGTYAWTGPNAFTSNAQNPVIPGATAVNAGTYSVTVTVNGCTSPAATTLVTVTPTPSPGFADNDGPHCVGDNLSLFAGFVAGATYNWTGPNGFTSNLQNPIITNVSAANAGVYSVTASVGSCTSTVLTTVVTINTPVTSIFAANNGPVCAGQDITMTATFVANATYLWTGPGSFSSNLQNPVIPNTTSLNNGVYSVMVTQNCGSPIILTTTVVINEAETPVATSNAPICVGGTMNLFANPIPGATYSWVGPNGFNSTLQNPTKSNVTLLDQGVYSVTVTQNGCVSAVATVSVTIQNGLGTITAGNNGPVCSGQPIQLSATTVAGGSYLWMGPNGYMDVTQNPNILSATAANAGVYSVTVTSGACSSTTATTTVVVNPTPLAKPSSNSPVCVGNTINLAAEGITGTYLWNGPNSFTSVLQNPTIAGATIANAGNYTLTVTVGGCVSLPQTTTVVVNNLPSSSIASNNGPLCAGATAQLLGSTVVGASYMWAGPNGFTSNLQNPTFINASMLNSGVYTLTTMVGACAAPVTTTNLVVSALPTAPAISSNSPVCAGSGISLTGPAIAGATYSWTGPNGFNANVQSPAIASATTLNAGQYNLVVTVNGCPSPASSLNVVVNPVPAMPIASSNSPVCAGQTLNLFASFVTGATYQWSGPAGFSSALANPSIANATVGASGIYSVVATAGGCSSMPGTVSVTVNPIPATPSAANNSPVCTGGTINLTATLVAGATYMWTGPGAFTSNAQNPSINNAQLANAGVYSVMVMANGCSAASPATTTVTVNQTPIAPATNSNSPVCTGNALNLTASTTAGATYSWTGPNGFSSAVQNPVISPTTPANGGIYSVTVTVNGCTSAAATVNAVINPTPAAPSVSSNTPVCAGQSLQFTSSIIPGAVYAWTGPNGFTSNQANPTILFATTASSGVYSLMVTVAGCTSPMATTTVVVNPRPNGVLASGNSTTCAGAPASFTLTLNGKGPWIVNYTANGTPQTVTLGNAGSPSPSTFIVPVTPTMTTVYSFSGGTDGNGCTLGIGGTNTITVNPLPTAQIVSPNVAICVGQTATYNVQVTGKGPWTITPAINGFPTIPVTVGGSATPSPAVFTLTVTPAATTTYTISAISDGNACVGTATGSMTVTVNPKPTLAVTTSNLVSCAGQTTNIPVTVTGQGPWTVQYSTLGGPLQTIVLGNAGSPSPSNFTIPVMSVGNVVYSFSSIVSGTGCSNTVTSSNTANVTVKPNPTATFSTGTVSVCGTSTGTNLNIVLTGQGPWTVNYTANGVPQTALTAGNAGSPSPFTFTLPVTPTVTTTYALGSITDGNTCAGTSTSTIIVKVDVAPTAVISSTTPQVCVGQPANVTLDLTGRGPWVVNYTRNGVAQTFTLGNSASPSPSTFAIPFSLTTTTTFTLTGVTGGNGCAGTVTGSVVVVVNPRPTAVFSSPTTPICVGGTANIQITLSGKGPWTVNYLANGIVQTPLTLGNAGTPSPTVLTVPLSPTVNTTYTITGVSDGNGCNSLGGGSSTIVTVNPVPTASFATGTNIELCKGNNTSLIVNVAGAGPWTVNYLENVTPKTATFGNSSTIAPTTFAITIAPTVNTTYTLTNVVSGAGCTGTAAGSVAVMLRDVPNAAFAGPSTINVCQGVMPMISVNVTQIPSGDNWTLTYMEGATMKTINGAGNGTFMLPTVMSGSSTTLTLTNIVNTSANPTCPRTLNATLNLNVAQNPQLCIVTHADAMTAGGTGNIQATATGGTGVGYQYSLDGISFGNTSGFFSNLAPGNYTVFVQDANLCSTLSLPIVIHDFVAPAVFLKTYQASGTEEGLTMIQTIDGGYLASGYTTSVGVGGEEASLTKYDSQGVVQWSKTYGGGADERANATIETTDGGYVIAGSTTTFGAGSSDFYVVKTDATGGILWSHTTGNAAEDIARSVVESADGGYVVAGTTRNVGSPLDRDVMLSKFDATGTLLWTKTFGNPSSLEDAWQIKRACGGGYIIVGSTNGAGSSTFDTYVIRVDAMGNEMWSRAYTSAANEIAYSVDNTDDGGFIVAGSFSSGSTADMYVAKLAADGTRQWSNRYGTADKDEARMIVRNSDASFSISGFTEKSVSSRASYLLKISQNGSSINWAKSYDTQEYNQFWGLTQATDGGYAAYGLAQQANGGNNFFFAKTDMMGNTNDCRQMDVPTTRTVLPLTTTVLTAPFAQMNPTITAPTPLDQLTTLNLTSVDICGPKPTALLMTNPPAICPGQSAMITVTLTGTAPWTIGASVNGAAPMMFSNITASPFMFSVTPSGVGQTTVTLTSVSDFNYSSGTVGGTSIITVSPPTTATAMLSGTPSSVCLGQTEVLTVDLTGVGPWTIGVSENGDVPIIFSNITSTPFDITVTPSAIGARTFTLTSVTGSSACFTTGTVSGSVVINTTPNTTASAIISGNAGTICLGQPATFTVNLTGTAPWAIKYSENGGAGIAVAGITSSPYILTVTPTGSGVRTYTLTEVFDANACANGTFSGSGTVTVNTSASATATISGTASQICLGQTAVFNVSLTGTSPWTIQYAENGGSPVTVSGITATPFQLTVTPTGTGTRTYTLVNVAGVSGCFGGAVSGSATVPVQTNSLATATISGSTTVCQGVAAPATAVLTFTLTGNAPWTINYAKNGGSPITISGITASPFTLTVTPGGTGSFTYTLTSVADGSACPGGSVSGAAIVNVLSTSTASLSGSATVCQGQTATLTVSLTGTAPWTVNVSQNGGAPTQFSNIASTPFTITVTPANLGVNTFTLTSVTDANTACGPGTVTGSAGVTVQAGTSATISGGGQTICQGQGAQVTLNLTGTSPWTVVVLENGANAQTFSNITGSPFIITVTPANLGTSTFTLQSVTGGASGCTGTSVNGSALVTVSATPVLTVVSKTDLACTGSTGSIQVNATGGTGITYSTFVSGTLASNGSGLFNNLPAGTYVITATNSAGCSSSVTVQLNQPATPTITSITGVTFGSATVNWTAIGGAAGYIVSIRVVGASSFDDRPQVTGTSLTLSGLQANTNYEVRVRAVCPNGTQSNNSNTQTFTTPVNSAVGSCGIPGGIFVNLTTSTTGTINWTANASGAVCYIVSYGPTSSNPNLWPQFLVPHPGNQLQLSGLLLGTEYGVRIRTNCTLCSANTGVRSPFSPTILFTTPTTKEDGTIETAQTAGLTQFNVYPNPNKGIFTVSFDASETESVNVTITDMTGRKVYDQTHTTVAGHNELPIDLSQQAAGVYLLQTNDGRSMRTTKVVVN